MSVDISTEEREALQAFADQQGIQWRMYLVDMALIPVKLRLAGDSKMRIRQPEEGWWGTATRSKVLGPLIARMGKDGELTPENVLRQLRKLKIRSRPDRVEPAISSRRFDRVNRTDGPYTIETE